MSVRDRHEFAYHVMRFLMQNFLKLVDRRNEVLEGEALLAGYARHFPEGMAALGPLFLDLRRRKAAGDFTPGHSRSGSAAELTAQVETFVRTFHVQFTRAFEEESTRHVVFRHLPTALNQGRGESRVFQGRADPPIQGCTLSDMDRLISAIKNTGPRKLFASPLCRAATTIEQIASAAGCTGCIERDDRLLEINYGACEGMTVAAARQSYPQLFAAWDRGADPLFPGGENTAAVLARLEDFAAERWSPAAESSAVCTHNVVMRCLLGKGLAIPQPLWYLLEISHHLPIFVVSTRRFGWFVEMEEDAERVVFQRFYCRSPR